MRISDTMSFSGAAFEIKQSTIPNAGRGLFSVGDIPAGTVIGEYGGERLRPGTVMSSTKRSYLYSTASDVMISPADDCVFKYANDIVDLKESMDKKDAIKYEGMSYNIDWLIRTDQEAAARELGLRLGEKKWDSKEFMEMERLYIKTTRDIKAGDECFVNYGTGYWRDRIRIASEKRRRKSLTR